MHISMWSLNAVDFFDFGRLFVKGEIPECSPTSNFKVTASFVVIGSIKHKGILSLNFKKLVNRVDDLKMILIL